MDTNIANLGELEGILCNFDGISKGLFHFFKAFKLAKLLEAFDYVKGKGAHVSTLLLSIIIFRPRNDSPYSIKYLNKLLESFFI
jgi:hypothetical protein